MPTRGIEKEYVQILRDYVTGQGEDQLYGAQQLGKWLLQQDISPEEMIDLHERALEQLGEVPEFVRASFSILTEVMIEYGNEHRSVTSLRSKHKQLQSEIAVASAMQRSLLPQELPAYSDVEIGLVSVAAKQISGDYYNIAAHDDGRFCLTIADITGKGISAAMCMSMLKYAMESLSEMLSGPNDMLLHLNRIVERNIDPSMFITMLFGCYDTNRHCFRYAVAGHEPGFVYRAREGRFYDMDGQGAALGLCSDSRYEEKEIHLDVGDVLILLTDGVTERKIDRYYLQREELVSYLQAEVGAPAQVMADSLYRRLLLLSQFELPDDYTMIVLRRT
ncbi:PP2C family protein-serine/threonine phosphatase [Brevibacillus choshinensis]|uniref:PP2C family protein-serine/threonine phosphatase n=1 Tax=Brevibacillus choshinensis TaxID=54911 RepID=A0ABX7FQT1_BRECH|nr:PP2C family protein-serine/threonine phosphatase [Brevibacillus choshinensis]QRG68160.1 PP2C family protein-serine/threonine phosphatase [Brevibacillus choshinensis]